MKTLAAFLLCMLMTICMYGQHRTLSLQYIDSSIKPGDDFYMYANGNWYDTATIAATESGAGARMEMSYTTRANIQNILVETAAAKSAPETIVQKVGDLYASGMDTITIEKIGYKPVQKFLDQIGAIKNGKNVMDFVAGQYTYGNAMLIGFYVAPDEKNSKRYLLQFFQSGLGLPDRDYYFKTDASTQDVVKAYQTYITKLFMLTGDNPAEATRHMNTVYALEKQMASSHKTNVELRDPQSNYFKMAVADLDKKMPFIGWKKLLVKLHANTDSINLKQPGYYAKLDTLLQTIPVDVWKIYLRFNLLRNTAFALSKDFVMADFEYTGKALSGQQQLKPRWEILYTILDAFMGEALGQLYVQKYFTPEAKRRMTELVSNLQKSFAIRIDNLNWMSDSTKETAKEKLASIINKVGYPDKWRDYSKVSINRNAFFENLISCGKNEYNYMINKLGKHVNPTDWGMTPPTNNAYYNATKNEIVFPAGILLFPMFDVNADDALNYGGIGVVIGHELTHGFDDQGAQFDKEGNLNKWWSKEDYEKFKAKGATVIAQYNGFTVFDSMHVNGALTQGENIADLGGVAIAYTAFKLTKEGQNTTKIDGLTPDQRFFLAYAQSWRRKITDQSLQQQVKTDPHSPTFFRVKGALMNFTPFYTAFNVQPGDRMYKPENERITIW